MLNSILNPEELIDERSAEVFPTFNLDTKRKKKKINENVR